MSDPACQRSHALQFLPGEGLLLDAFDFGDIFDHANSVERRAVGASDNGCGQVDPDDFTVFLPVPFVHAVEGYLAIEELLGEFYDPLARHPGA